MKKEVPFIVFSDNDLEDRDFIGEKAVCPNCGEYHAVKYGDKVLEDGTKIPDNLLAYIKCEKNDKAYLVGIKGKLIK